MCIFSGDTVVKSTQEFVGVLSPTRRLLGYSNGVTTKKGGSVMMLPIPTEQEVIFHDTTLYPNWLERISQRVLEEATKGRRGGATLDLFKTVGAYKMLMVEPKDVVSTLINLRQAVQIWTYDMVEAYEDYKWLFVVIPEGREISSQPILIEFEQSINPEQLYFPLMDVHGDDEVSPKVLRNHILSIGDLEFSICPETSDFQMTTPNFPWNNEFLYTGTTLLGNTTKNGDVWATAGKDENKNKYWKMRMETPYQF